MEAIVRVTTRALCVLLAAGLLLGGCGGPEKKQEDKPIEPVRPTVKPSLKGLLERYKEQQAVGTIDYDGLIGELKRIVKDFPDYPEAVYNLGVLLEETGKLDIALKAYAKALSLKPDFAEAATNIARVHMKRGTAKAGVADFQKLAAKNPDSAAVQKNLADMLRAAGQYKEAEAALKRALARAPDDPDTLALLARLYFERGQSELCKMVAAMLIPRNAKDGRTKENAALYNLLAQILIKEGDNRLAVQQLEQALAADPKAVAPRMNFGLLALEFKDYETAAENFQAVLQEETHHVEAHVGLGVALRGLGRNDEAVAHYNKALQVDPKNPQALYALGVLNEKFVRPAKLQEALDYFKKYQKAMGKELTQKDPSHAHLVAIAERIKYKDLAAKRAEEKKRLEAARASAEAKRQQAVLDRAVGMAELSAKAAKEVRAAAEKALAELKKVEGAPQVAAIEIAAREAGFHSWRAGYALKRAKAAASKKDLTAARDAADAALGSAARSRLLIKVAEKHLAEAKAANAAKVAALEAAESHKAAEQAAIKAEESSKSAAATKEKAQAAEAKAASQAARAAAKNAAKAAKQAQAASDKGDVPGAQGAAAAAKKAQADAEAASKRAADAATAAAKIKGDKEAAAAAKLKAGLEKSQAEAKKALDEANTAATDAATAAEAVVAFTVPQAKQAKAAADKAQAEAKQAQAAHDKVEAAVAKKDEKAAAAAAARVQKHAASVKKHSTEAQAKAEQAKQEEAARKKAEERKAAEQKKLEEEKKKAEEAKKAAEEAKAAEAAKKAAEQKKFEEEKTKAEAAKKAAEAAKKAEEQQKLEAEKKKAEEAKKAGEEAKKAEETKKAPGDDAKK